MNIFDAIRTRSLKQEGRKLYYTKYYWEVRYLCGGFDVDFYREPKGCLVCVYWKGKKVADWVDQTGRFGLGIKELEVFDEFQFKNLIKAKPAFVGN